MSNFLSDPSSTSILHVCEQRRLWRDCADAHARWAFADRLCDKYHNLMSWLDTGLDDFVQISIAVTQGFGQIICIVSVAEALLPLSLAFQYYKIIWKMINAHVECYQLPLSVYCSSRKRTNISVITIGPRQANLVLIAYASSEGSGEPAHPRSLARTSAARSYKQWVKRNLQKESQIPGPSE